MSEVTNLVNLSYNDCTTCFLTFGSEFVASLNQSNSGPQIQVETPTTPASVFEVSDSSVESTTNETDLCSEELYFDEEYLYLFLLIPAALIVAILAILSKRKYKYRDCCGGHPGLIYPVNLLQDYKDRFTIAAAFALTAWQMLSIILGNDFYPFPRPEPNIEHKAFYVLAACIIYAFVYYPIFACLSFKSVVSYALGTLYVWALGIIFVINNGYCWPGDKRALALDIAEDLPAWFCLAWLCTVFPLRFLMKCWKVEALEKFSMSSNLLRYQIDHIADVFKKNHQRPVEKRWYDSMIYRSIPAFKFSTTMFAAAFCAIIFVWMTAMSTLQTYYITLRYFDKAMRLAIKAYKETAALKGEAMVPVGVIPDPYLEMVLRAVAQYEGDADKLKIETMEEIYYWFQIVEACTYTALVLSLIFAVFHLCRTLVSYREDLLNVYRGVYTDVPKLIETAPRNALINYSRYIGYQAGFSTWGFLIQMFVIFVILLLVCTFFTFVLRYEQYWILDWIFRRTYAVFVITFILMLAQNLMTQCLFMQKNSLGYRVLLLDNRNLFFNFHYFSTFASVAVGMVSCLLRIVKSLVFGLWTVPRLDISTLNRYFERFDPGFQSYVGLLTVENAQSNPVMVVFVSQLYDTLRERNGLKSVGGAKVNPLPIKDRVYRKRDSYRRAVIRWTTLYTLTNNPGLLLYRKKRNVYLPKKSMPVDSCPLPVDIAPAANFVFPTDMGPINSYHLPAKSKPGVMYSNF